VALQFLYFRWLGCFQEVPKPGGVHRKLFIEIVGVAGHIAVAVRQYPFNGVFEGDFFGVAGHYA
jgi:hypothetical protein